MKNFSTLEKYCTIKENHVFAKVNCTITINTTHFKKEDDQMIDVGDTDEKEELNGSISIPASFTINFEDNSSIDIYLPFDVNIIIHDEDHQGDDRTFYYQKDELIFCAFTKSSATDIVQVDALFENRVKYLNGKIDKQVLAIHKQLMATTNVQMNHIELLLSNSYIAETDDGAKALRLTSRQYSQDTAVGLKDATHKTGSDTQGFSYGYNKDMIINSLTSNQNNLKSDIDKVIIGDFGDDLKKREDII